MTDSPRVLQPLPAVTVVTPTRNRLHQLCDAMDSVRRQSFDGWEHIVVDDGSNDGTTEEVSRRAESDPRVRYIARPPGPTGANVCRNIGIRSSRSDLIVFLDSDDLLSPDCLGRRVEIMGSHPHLDFAVFPAGVFKVVAGDEKALFARALSAGDLDRFLYLEHPWEITGPVWRRSALNRIGGFAEQLPSWQDVDLHIRALIAGLSYAKFEQVDHYVRWACASEKTSRKQFDSPEHLMAGMSLIRELHTRLREADLLGRGREHALAGLWFLLAHCWTRQGRAAKGRRAWRYARQTRLATFPVSAFGLLVLFVYGLRLFDTDHNERLVERFKRAAGFRLRPFA